MQKIKLFYLPILFISIGCLVTGCATRYHEMDWAGGGYSEIKAAEDSFIVTFRGNGYTSEEKVLKYALRRAAELTVKNGYKYFSVDSSIDQTRSYGYSTTSENVNGSAQSYSYLNSSNTSVNASSSASTYSGIVRQPGLSIAVKCYKKKPKSPEVIEAEFYLANNS